MQIRRKARVAADEPRTIIDLPTYSSSRSRRKIHLEHLVAVLCGSSMHTCAKKTMIPRPPPSAIKKTADLVKMKRRPRRKETTSSVKLTAIRAPWEPKQTVASQRDKSWLKSSVIPTCSQSKGSQFPEGQRQLLCGAVGAWTPPSSASDSKGASSFEQIR